MMVMVSNQTGTEMGILAGRFWGRIGHLYSPGAERGPWEAFRYGLDNKCFVTWSRGAPWIVGDWYRLLEWAQQAKQKPMWALVPDMPTNREGTLAMWHQYVETVRRCGFRPALALQDGMTFDDVPDSDCMLFVGGSTEWKEAAIGPWCERFPGRVHVGRVNTMRRLRACYEAGAVSVDGTGWYHEVQRRQLTEFLEETTPMRKAA